MCTREQNIDLLYMFGVHIFANIYLVDNILQCLYISLYNLNLFYCLIKNVDNIMNV